MSGNADAPGDGEPVSDLETPGDTDPVTDRGTVEEASTADGETASDLDWQSSGPPFDVTMVAVGTSVTWGTGNAYENKFVDLVHRDLNGGYPDDETYLHFNPGENETPTQPRYPYESDTAVVYPEPSYYNQTLDDGYTLSGSTDEHPRGPHVPPSRQRARGGGIIGLSWPAKVAVGGTQENPPCGTDDNDLQYNDQGGYLATGPTGNYDGKLDGLNRYTTLNSKYSQLFDEDDIDRSKWLSMRDIGWGWPTIVDQIEQFDPGGQQFSAPAEVPVSDQPDLFEYKLPKTAPRGEDVDMVIIDGGTNDMQLGWLNNPMDSGRPEIREAAKLYFYDNMTGENMPGEPGLLQRARDAFPNAVIVVLGYPVWTSNRTDNARAREFLVANSLLGAAAVEAAIDNPLNFSHFQAHYLRKAVAEVARDDDGPGMIFAPPGYGIVNAMMADWPWSFGVKPNPDSTIPLDKSISVDDTRVQREQVCEAELEWEEANASDDCGMEIAEDVACPAAGVGHPNNEGSRQYADTIVRRYKQYRNLSVRDGTDGLDEGTESLRESLAQYGIGPEGRALQPKLSGGTVGTRFALSQRVVDGMQVSLTTADLSDLGEGLNKGRPYLTVRPGRRGAAGEGSGERFALDTEDRNFAPGDTDEFYLDPMMRRRLTGPVGNIDEGELGVKTGQTEPDAQTVHPPGHWSDQRLRLEMMDHLTLEVEGVDPGDGWALEEVSYQINGSIEGTRTFSPPLEKRDFRSRVRSNEFQVASFNHVDGATADDIDMGSWDFTLDTDGIGSTAELTWVVSVENTANVRIPSVLLQYGLQVDGAGRDWQVLEVGDLDPGETKRPTTTLKARHDPLFHAGQLQFDAVVFVGDTEKRFSDTKKRSDLT